MSIEVVAVGGGDCGASRFPLFHQETSLLFLWGFLESSNRLHAVKMFCLGLGRRAPPEGGVGEGCVDGYRGVPWALGAVLGPSELTA